MTKSQVLVIADDPERMMGRYTQGTFEAFEDVTAEFRQLVRQFSRGAPPTGISPTPEFQLKMAIKKAAGHFFEHGHVLHELGSAALNTVQQNHVVLLDDHLHAAFRGVPPRVLDKIEYAQPFDYWFGAWINYLPLRNATQAAPYHPKTVLADGDSYYADIPSSNEAAIADVDLHRIYRARLETHTHLEMQATKTLHAAGHDTAFDWQPRYDAAGRESAGYFDQAKPRLLHGTLPDHAKRIDFLLLDKAQIDLFLRWGMIPVCYVITQQGGLVSDRHNATPQDRLFEQITQTNARLLRAIRDAWHAAQTDTTAAIFTGHE